MAKKQKERKFSLYHLFGIVLLCFLAIIFIFDITLAYFRDESKSSSPIDYLVIGGLDLQVQTNFDKHHFSLDPDTIYTTNPVKNASNLYDSICTNIIPTDKNAIPHVLIRVQFDINFMNNQGGVLGPCVDASNRPYIELFFNEGRLFEGDENTEYNIKYKNNWFKCGDFYYFIGTAGKKGSFSEIKNATLKFNDGYKVNNNLQNSIMADKLHLFCLVQAIQARQGALIDSNTGWTKHPITNNPITLPKVLTSYVSANFN